MGLFEDTNPRALKELLSEIDSRASVLPDFQRDFVWEPSATQELIVSIASNYPAGSILRVRDTKRVFAAREFEGAPKLNGTKHTFLVLDGQQRLTSLYQAFFGKGEHRYYLDLRKLMNDADFEEAIFHERAATKRVKLLDSFEAQSKELILPLAVLRGGAGGFLQWLLQATHPLPQEDRLAMLDGLTKLNERWIKVIDDYHFPVVTLSESTDAAALCTIFEVLNRTGVTLTAFELLTARFWPAGVNLRELWERAKEDHAELAEFVFDPYYILQVIALVRGSRAPSCKRKAVLDLSAEDIKAWWERVVHGIATGIRILRDDCHVVLPKWLPYYPMLIPLGAVLARHPLPKSSAAGAHRERIKRWFWCAVFGQAYENAVNSKAERDFVELSEWLQGGPPPTTVTTVRFDPKSLRDITPRQRSIYKGVICLILGQGARDFHTQAVITGNLMRDEGIDDHHVFPASYLEKKRGVTVARVRDCVLNRTLIDRTTNQIISDRPPSEYMAEIRDTQGFPFDAVLASHCLPSGPDAAFWTNDYDGFLDWREGRIWQEIRRVTGVAGAADLELSGTALL